MGDDFVDKTKGTFEKGWDKGIEELARPDLFTISPEAVRTIFVKPVNGHLFSETEDYEVRQDLEQILVYQAGIVIGTCDKPGQFVLNQLASIGGLAPGKVNRFRVRSGGVDLAVFLNL